MSTNVRIKQKALFNKKLEMKDIVALTGLAYGVIDDNYRLIRNEMAENTLIYFTFFKPSYDQERNSVILSCDYDDL